MCKCVFFLIISIYIRENVESGEKLKHIGALVVDCVKSVFTLATPDEDPNTMTIWKRRPKPAGNGSRDSDSWRVAPFTRNQLRLI